MRLDGKVYLLTGGGGAVAASIAEVFAGAGARLALADIHAETVKERAEKLGGLGFGLDLTDYAATQALVGEVQSRMGRLDGLIHTVGGFAFGPVRDADPEVYDRMFERNMKTLFYAVRAVLPVLLEQKEGFIAGFAAAPAWEGKGPNKALYAAAKSAAATFLRSVDGELEGTDIRVAILYPMGTIDTPDNRQDLPGADPSQWIDPREIAQALLFAASRSRRGRVLELPIFPPR
ncbi:MAG: SDR family NAD(P)-dependent oxidoreductase [Meiothermus silvanus]|nr:SDR family NAD(P)-dependent oxidoreductase [Allomeiothermus silvanus]